MSVQSWHLSVNRAEFAKALRSVGRAGKDVRSAMAVLTFDQNRLAIDLLGSVTQLPASGDWPSEVRLLGVHLERLARSLPEEDPLPLRVEGKRLFVARFSIPCECRLSGAVSTPVRELIPANANLFDLLTHGSKSNRTMKKKLTEVALPLEAINKESAREKAIRHGHPSTLHLWWARRPKAACRAVLFASLVDDPSSLPEQFPTEADQDKERQRLFRLIGKQLGNEPRVVSGAKCGCDIESKIGATGKLRFIEVKGRVAGAITVTVTRNEILTALNKPDDFILAVGQVEDGRQKLVYIRKPFRQEPEFAVESINYNLQELLARGEQPA